MNVEELRAVVREDFLDDTVEPYRWSDDQILRWLNRGQEEACRRQRLLVEEIDTDLTEITLQDNVATYALHSKVVLIDRLVYDQKTITKTTKDQLDRKYPYWRQMEPGEPMFYLQNGLNVRLVPTPGPAENNGTLTVRPWHLPKVSLQEDDDEPVIDPAYHEELCLYAAARAYSMPDEDLRDDKLAKMHMDHFDATFGPPMSADVLAHRRRHADTSFVGQKHVYHGRQSATMLRDPFDYED